MSDAIKHTTNSGNSAGEILQIDDAQLARELGLEMYRRPAQEYANAQEVLTGLCDFIPDILRAQRGGNNHLKSHLEKDKDTICKIFDRYEGMGNVIILFTKEMLQVLQKKLPDIEITDIKTAIWNMIVMYVYHDALKKKEKNAKNIRIVWSESEVDATVTQDVERSKKIAWLGAVKEAYHSLFLCTRKTLSEIPPDILIFSEVESITNGSLKDLYFQTKITIWTQPYGHPERLLILMEDESILGSANDELKGKIYDACVADLNFYLCQYHTVYYDDLYRRILRDERLVPVWERWMKKYGNRLQDEKSQIYRVFCYIFRISGEVFTETKELGDGARRMKKIYKAALQNVLGNKENKEKKYPRGKTRSESPVQTVAHQARFGIPGTAQLQAGENVHLKNENIFPDGANKEQPRSINLSQCGLPDGTKAVLMRTIGRKKDTFKLTLSDNPIGPLVGEEFSGNYIYEITLTLPDTHRFPDGKRVNTFVEKRYIKIEAPSEKLKPDQRFPISQVFQKKVAEVLTPPPVAPVAQLDHRVESLAAVAMILAEYPEYYESIGEVDSEGDVTLQISPDHISAVMDDVDDFLPQYGKWIISPSDQITPECDTDVSTELLNIALRVRKNRADEAKKAEELEQERAREKAIQREYEHERVKFAPLLDFLNGFTLDKDISKEKMNTVLDSYGWTLPAPLLSGFVWRHKIAKIKIIYDKPCLDFNIIAEKEQRISPGLLRCYEEIAQTAARIVLFFYADNRTREKLIVREKKLHEEMKIGAEAYETLLKFRKAKLVVYEKKPVQGARTADFRGYMPSILGETASHTTLQSILERYPNAELCYRLDAIHIGSEMKVDASDDSVENTIGSFQKLRISTRARNILRKRVLITLGLDNSTREREPIKNGIDQLNDVILQVKVDKWNAEERKMVEKILYKYREIIKNIDIPGNYILSKILIDYLVSKINENMIKEDDINSTFIDMFIDELEIHRIRIHYVSPMSVTLAQHQKILKNLKKT